VPSSVTNGKLDIVGFLKAVPFVLPCDLGDLATTGRRAYVRSFTPYLPEPSRHAFVLRPDEVIWRYGTHKAARRQGLSYVIPPSLDLVRRVQT
jgi:hypothetical protein